MRVFKVLGRLVSYFLIGLVLFAGAMWAFGPREPAELSGSFDARKFGEGVQVYFESIESGVEGLRPGVKKRVIWREGFKEQRTPVSVLYLHGFSATSEEIRPVPDLVADALGANLVYTRLTGHGRDGEALAKATVADWMHDLAEGLAAARAVGERVVVLSTSTGGTLAAAAAMDAELSKDVAAMIFVSPNFGVNDPAAPLLTLPGARWWVPLVAGPTRSFAPDSDAQAAFWTTSYPTVSLLPMAALVKAVAGLDFSQARVPALFWISPEDQVVRADITVDVADRWGGVSEVHTVATGEGIDPSGHVIAGAIMSPAGTDPAMEGMVQWLRSLGI